MNQTQNHTEVNVQSPNPSGMAQFEIYVPQRVGYPQMQPQMYPQINLQKAILHEQMQIPTPQADPKICVIAHILVVLATAYLVYIMYESGLFALLNQFFYGENQILRDFAQIDSGCWNFFTSYYYLTFVTAGFSVWTLLSLVWFSAGCERDLCCWTFMHTAFVVALGMVGLETKTSVCQAGYAFMSLFAPVPREPLYVFFGLCAAGILLIITGKIYVNRKLQALRREQERKKLEALLLVK